jgi:hypothetical protein
MGKSPATISGEYWGLERYLAVGKSSVYKKDCLRLHNFLQAVWTKVGEISRGLFDKGSQQLQQQTKRVGQSK